MEFRILGPLEVVSTGGEVPVARGRQRQLLALLVVRPREIVRASRLAEDLWGEQLPSDVGNAVQSVVSKLRRALGADAAILPTEGDGYRLEVPGAAIDAVRFETEVAAGRAALAVGDPRTATEHFAAGLALWRGPALDGLADEGLLYQEAVRLEEVRLTALEERCRADLRLDRHLALIPELEGLIAEHPLREPFHGFLMIALYRAGRQADALRAFQRARSILIEELGIDPSVELRSLEAAVLAQDPALDPEPPPAPERWAAPVPGRTNLSTESLSSFIGRRDDLAALGAAVEEHRLLTVVGPGGAGKTRLAREVGVRRLEFDDCWLVELAPIRDHHLVGVAVADALGLQLDAEASVNGVAAVLHGRDATIVLDNCEHLVAAVALVAEQLLLACPRLRILATSREPLGVSGENVWVIPPMRLADAVELFTDRASAVSRFRPSTDTEQAVEDLCNRLDGLPLAVELAAARVRAIPVHQLVERLDDRFRLLTGGARTALPRHQTLRSVVEWSYDLLFEDEQRVFEQLGVFVGGCTLEAAEAVCGGEVPSGELAEILARLVDKSLVVAQHDRGDVRFDLLQTLALYARERLEESEHANDVRARHMAYYAQVCDRGALAMRGEAEATWLAEARGDSENIRAALEWAVTQGHAETALAMVGGLGWWWWLSGQADDGWRRSAAALCLPGGRPVTRAWALLWAGYLAVSAGAGVERGLALGEDAVELARSSGDDVALAELQSFLGGLYESPGKAVGVAAARERRRATDLYEQAARGHADDDRPWGRAIAARSAGAAARLRGEVDDAARLTAEAAAIFDEAGADWALVIVGGDLAALAELRGDIVGAAAAVMQARRVATRLGLGRAEATLVVRLANLTLLAGDVARAEALHSEGLALGEAHSYQPGVAMALLGLAWSCRSDGRVAEARAFATRALAFFRTARIALGEAVALATLGSVAELRGDLDEAARLHHEALESSRRADDPRGMALALEGLAGVAAGRGDGDGAGERLGAASHLRSTGGVPPDPASEADRIRRLTTAITGDGFGPAFARGAGLDLDQIA